MSPFVLYCFIIYNVSANLSAHSTVVGLLEMCCRTCRGEEIVISSHMADPGPFQVDTKPIIGISQLLYRDTCFKAQVDCLLQKLPSASMYTTDSYKQDKAIFQSGRIPRGLRDHNIHLHNSYLINGKEIDRVLICYRQHYIEFAF